MFLIASQSTNEICLWCIFVLMLGSFLIGYFGKNIKFPSKKINTTNHDKESEKEERERIKPLGVIKTMERSGNATKNDV